jgi:hypothetical protein
MTDWIRRRQRALHHTIRHSDVPGFDVASLARHLRAWRVDWYSFFASGYVTLYPSALPFQTPCPGLDGRDLVGEILEAVNALGARTFPTIDLGEIPEASARANPGFAAVKADGSFFVKSDGIVTSCPLGTYVRGAGPEVIAEVAGRYQFSGFKFGGASYSGPPGVCHCDACRAAYPGTLPAQASDPAYSAWRQRIRTETVQWLQDTVRRICGKPAVGNNIWSVGEAKRIDDLVASQDLSQIEVQSRTHMMPDDAAPCWERFTFPTETARYFEPIAPHPPLLPPSYFLAWPWRRIAVPWPEQKLYLAQIVANGCSPTINYSGGHPDTHEDPRGHRAHAEMFQFMERHADLLDGDRCAATVAIVVDYPTIEAGGGYERYQAELKATEDALDRHHIPYEIVASDQLHRLDATRLAALVLPGATCLRDEQATAIAALVARGVGLVATGAPGRSHSGGERDDPPLARLCGAASIGAARGITEQVHVGPNQAYARIVDPTHPVVAGIACGLLAVGDLWHPVRAESGTAPLVRGPCFRVFPEGLSSPDRPDPGEPLALCREHAGGGRTVLMPFQPGRTAARTGHPDAERLIADAVRWAARNRLPVRLDGFADVLLTARSQPGRLLIHLINALGRRRHLDQFHPVTDVVLELPQAARTVRSACLGDLGGGTRITVPRLVDYDIICCEMPT